jgi:hypothetical protein
LLQKHGRSRDNGKSHLTSEGYERDARKLQKKEGGKGLLAVFHNHQDFAPPDEAQVLAGGRFDGGWVALQSLDLVAHEGIFMLQLVEAQGSLHEIVLGPEPANQTTLAHYRVEKHNAAHENQDTAHPQTLSVSRPQLREPVVYRCRNHCVRKVPDSD